MKRKVNVLIWKRENFSASPRHSPSQLSSYAPSKIEKFSLPKQEEDDMKINKIFFPFASHFNFTIGTLAQELSAQEENVFMSNYPSLITHYLLLTRFIAFRISFCDMKASDRRRRCVIETALCDTELLN